MKTFKLKLLSPCFILCCFFTNSVAQSAFRFVNPVLISGTQLQAGAVYRFANVNTGTDAIVTIVGFVNGATLDSIDRVSTGYNEAFQPIVRIPRRQNGYAEFKIDFVVAGTNVPFIQPSVSASPIDVDGEVLPGDTLFETDQLNLGGGLVDFDATTTQLSITTSGNWVIARNIGGVEYTGIDTNATAVRFTVTNSNISSLTLRMGADNRSNNTRSRNRSVYFKPYTYSNSALPALSLVSFRGTEKDKHVELQWDLIKDHGYSKIIVEKGTDKSHFKSIGEVLISTEAGASRHFRFADNSANGNVYYRLKIITVSNNIEFSNVLVFRCAAESNKQFKIYPASIKSTATISMVTERKNNAVFQLVDYSGRIVYKKDILLQPGNNNIQIADLNNIQSGNYVAVVKTDNNTYNQKLIKH